MPNLFSTDKTSKKLSVSDQMLYDAVVKGDVEAARKALNKGFLRKPADPNVRINNDKTLISIAMTMEGDHEELIKLLLTSGANPKLTSLTRKVSAITDLIFESKGDAFQWEMGKISRSATVLEQLINHGVNIKYPPDETNAAVGAWLQLAIARNDIGLVNLLLRQGIDTADCKQLGSALSLAAKTSARMTRFLLEKGFDVTGEEVGCSPLLDALSTYSYYEHDYDNRPAGDLTETVRLLLEQGAKVNHRTLSGHSPLMLTVYRPDYPEVENIITLLLSHGAEINAQSSPGETPLMLAIQMCNEKATVCLINAGADIHIQDRQGRNALAVMHHIENRFLEGATGSARINHFLRIAKEHLGKAIEVFHANYRDKQQKVLDENRSESLLHLEEKASVAAEPAMSGALHSFSKMIHQLEGWVHQDREKKMTQVPSRRLMALKKEAEPDNLKRRLHY